MKEGSLWDGLKSALRGAENALRASADDVVQKSADFAAGCGLGTYITRVVHGDACSFCRGLAGRYAYATVSKSVYYRHDGCECTVTYTCSKGTQNVHTKQWTRADEADKIEARKMVGLNETAGIIQKRINQGEYSTKLSHQQYLKHVYGTAQYDKYLESRRKIGKSDPSVLTISEDEAQTLILENAGKGTPLVSNGEVRNKEFAAADFDVGKVMLKSGEWVSTRRFCIYYGRKSSHIVPVKEDYHG